MKSQEIVNVKIQSSHQYLFTILGSTGPKAARRTLMKLTPGGLHNSRQIRSVKVLQILNLQIMREH